MNGAQNIPKLIHLVKIVDFYMDLKVLFFSKIKIEMYHIHFNKLLHVGCFKVSDIQGVQKLTLPF